MKHNQFKMRTRSTLIWWELLSGFGICEETYTLAADDPSPGPEVLELARQF
jgi:hypothetical protein